MCVCVEIRFVITGTSYLPRATNLCTNIQIISRIHLLLDVYFDNCCDCTSTHVIEDNCMDGRMKLKKTLKTLGGRLEIEFILLTIGSIGVTL